MNAKRIASTVAGLGFLFALGLVPNPASAQTAPPPTNPVVLPVGPVIPAPCADCTNHNAVKGDGKEAAIYTVLHACDTITGKGMDTFFLGNPTSSPVPFDLRSFAGTALNPGAIQAIFVGTIPPSVGGRPGEFAFSASDVDHNGVIVIAGTIGSRTKVPEQFACPCLTPDTTTTVVSSPPSSGGPPATIPGTTPGVPHPPAGTPGTGLTSGTLPATGGAPWLIVELGLLAGAIGALAVAVARKPWAER